MTAQSTDLCKRVHEASGNTPIAVGFGISTREHFLQVGDVAEGVVIGSQFVTLLKESTPENRLQVIKEYCQKVTGRDGTSTIRDVPLKESVEKTKVVETAEGKPSAVVTESTFSEPGPLEQIEALNAPNGEAKPNV